MSDYELINTGINLLTGIGTVGAVVVALYLARTQNLPRLLVRSRIVSIHGHPTISPERNFVHVSVINAGTIREYVHSFGYSIGFLKWKTVGRNNPAVDLLNILKFPAFSEPGEEVSDYIDVELFDKLQMRLFVQFFDELPLPKCFMNKRIILELLMRTARCWAAPARGNVVSVALDKNLQEHIVDQYAALIGKGEREELE